MNQETLIDRITQRITELQNEILSFTWEQVGGKADKFYVQGKIATDDSGNVTMRQGQLEFAVIDYNILNSADVLDNESYIENVRFVKPRVQEIYDLLFEMQGKSPVRFRWAVDTETGQVEGDWTYYDDLTEEEKKDDSWKHWRGDFAWKAQLEAELIGAR